MKTNDIELEKLKLRECDEVTFNALRKQNYKYILANYPAGTVITNEEYLDLVKRLQANPTSKELREELFNDCLPKIYKYLASIYAKYEISTIEFDEFVSSYVFDLKNFVDKFDVDKFPASYGRFIGYVKRNLFTHITRNEFWAVIGNMDLALKKKCAEKVSVDGLLYEEDLDKLVSDNRLIKIAKENLDALKPNQKKMLELFYGLNGNKRHTTPEIGKMYNCTHTWICAILTRAINNLRRIMYLSLKDLKKTGKEQNYILRDLNSYYDC